MEWKEILCTLAERGVISDVDLIEFEALPAIRDKVFSEYEQLGYISEKTEITEVNDLFTIQLGLIATNASRKIALSYSFSSVSPSPLMGFINDEVFNLRINEGWEMMMQIKLRAERKFNIILPRFYKALRNYNGSFEERVFECLMFMKQNYDLYAKEIIEGKEWDDNAWKSYM